MKKLTKFQKSFGNRLGTMPYECPRCHFHDYQKTAIWVEFLSRTKKDVLTCNNCGKEFLRKYSNNTIRLKSEV